MCDCHARTILLSEKLFAHYNSMFIFIFIYHTTTMTQYISDTDFVILSPQFAYYGGVNLTSKVNGTSPQ